MRGMRWTGHVARAGKRALVGKSERERPFGRPRRRWDDNIKMDFKDVGCGGMDWIKLTQDRIRWREVVNESSGSIKCGDFLG